MSILHLCKLGWASHVLRHFDLEYFEHFDRWKPTANLNVFPAVRTLPHLTLLRPSDAQVLPMDTQCVPSPKLRRAHPQCTSVCIATTTSTELLGDSEAWSSEAMNIRAAGGDDGGACQVTG